LLNQRIPYAQIEPTVLFDGLDNRLNPTHGYSGLVSCKGMFPIDGRNSNFCFARFFTEQSFFVPLWHSVLAFRLRFGHIFRRQFRNIAPPERFYLGGANSIRAYDTDRCPPLGIVHDEDGATHRVPRGGKSMVNFNIELRIPTFKHIWAVVFQDVGALAGDNFRALAAHGTLAATGVGVRYMTPIGPLRFDIGWKWHRQKDECPYAWFLTLGNAF
jgi:translocation and assembly module TamA